MFSTKTIPTIAIVGRQNVGKSTLYNRITRSRDALVADFPGITRDPKIGLGVVGEKEYLIADTGGFSYNNEDNGLLNRVMHSTKEIALEAEIILFVVDSREGLTEQDRAVASEIRTWDYFYHLYIRLHHLPVVLVQNNQYHIHHRHSFG